MTNDDERIERDERAQRLKQAREAAGFAGPKAVADGLKINVNTYKAHEQGRNGFGIASAHAYADFFNVSVAWLYMNIGKPDEAQFLGKNQPLRNIFEQAAIAPEDIQSKIVSYATFELGRIETATKPHS